jgi:formiminoglutamase/agmatinase
MMMLKSSDLNLRQHKAMKAPQHLKAVPIAETPSFPDPHIRWLSEVVKPWTGSGSIDAGILGIPFDRGVASHRQGARFGPKVVREELYASSDYCIHHGVSYSKMKLRDLGNIDVNVMDYDVTHKRVESTLEELFSLGVPIMTIGGDHSLTSPIVKGLSQALGHKPRIGIIDFDTHHDIREGWTRNSGLWSRELLQLPGQPVRGKNFVQIGVHGYRYSLYYHQRLQEYGVRLHTTLDVRRKGMEAVAEESLGAASDGTDAIYLTVDIDVLDQAFAPGTNAAYPGGLMPEDLMEGVFGGGKHPLVKAMDVMEIAPPLDLNNMTSRRGADVLLSFLCGMANRGRSD